jgi:hypothetical protein
LFNICGYDNKLTHSVRCHEVVQLEGL